MSNREYGNKSEDKAVRYLENRGFIVTDRNYYAKKLGEIDIVAVKDGVLHFIEVKSSHRSFEPVYNITTSKLHKIIKSAQYYMNVKKLDTPYCIDAVIVKKNSIEFIENITM